MHNARVAGASAAIVYNNPANGPANFNGTLGTVDDAGTPWIPAISLSQTDVHIPVGTMTAFAVTGTTRDGSRVDVTQQADARSADQSVATVAHGQGSQILINAVAQGSTTIAVTVGSLQQTCAVTVTSR